MKKNLIALLIVALVTVGLFATDPTSFQVTTTVDGINEMGITKTAMTLANFNLAAGNLFSTLTIGGSGGSTLATDGAVTFEAYLSTRSNNRSGYTVKVSATPMVTEAVGQTTPTINYIVEVAGDEEGSYSTADGGDAVSVITISKLTATDVQSRAISLTVDMADYNAAITGSYTGTVTFTYTSNS